MGRGWREEEEEAAAVLELMSACQIRNTMHLRQRLGDEKKGRKGGKGEKEGEIERE